MGTKPERPQVAKPPTSKVKPGTATPPAPKPSNPWEGASGEQIEKFIDIAVLAGYTCGMGEAAGLFRESQALAEKAGLATPTEPLKWDHEGIHASLRARVSKQNATVETRYAVIGRVKNHLDRMISLVAASAELEKVAK